MTKINWRVRFRNKIWLGSFLSLIVGFVYSMLALFDKAGIAHILSVSGFHMALLPRREPPRRCRSPSSHRLTNP